MRWVMLGGALLLPVACAQGVQDDNAVGGLGTGASADGGSSGSSSAGKSGATTSAGSGHSGSTGSSGSASAGAPSAGASSGGTSGAAFGGAGSSGAASGGAAAGGKGGSGGSSGSSSGAPSGGSSGSGSAGTSSGGGGTAGAVASGGSGGSVTNSGFTVQYQALQATPTEAYMSALIHATNNSTGSVAVSQFKIRYYFTDEPKVQLQMTINYAHVQISGNQFDMTVTNSVVGMAPTFSTADTYIEFGFNCSSHQTLAPGESLDFAWQVQGPDPAHNTYTQTNDYSFNSTKTAGLSSWDHVILFQSNAVIWGTLPG